MMCVFFFVCLCTAYLVEIMLQFQTSGGGLRCKSEYPWCIIKVKSKHFPTVFKKNREKQKKK
ncbi:Uncharacterized protein FWK35_00018228 [Aphis craccivora]|uniref:Uncharacterized protein n=1 Tax=Aphis craccivora TaxID=307492 RepID=A0A6G0YXI9_APHCR|nr:Uncharacterized protein FWK35_00018228 [Aphis craccivora]